MYKIKAPSSSILVIVSFSLCSFLIGIIFFLYLNSYIIIRVPFRHQTNTQQELYKEAIFTKKEVTLYYWHHERWHHLKSTILSYADPGETAFHLINHLLSTLQEESIITKQVAVEAILLSADQHTAYLSFTRNPFNKEESTYAKWMLVESILKTLRENSTSFFHVHFLVSHQPLIDIHIDFSRPWPIAGFFT